MTLAMGTKLGPYEVVVAIGAGGMGEVYRARDTRLGRDVALKVLPESFAQDAQRMARFEREAKVLASLSHPNIAAVFGLEDSAKTRALVMELVEGPTLAERIKSGANPIEETLPIAKQICEAMEYAHEHGIVHRDLKPSNIKITPEGQVKVLDFGLAKALEGEAASADQSNSPTLSAMATRAGFLLGTAAYMSPEQAKGKAADRRADIWAFGCVLYEMLTGKMAFGGETVSDTLAAVIRAEPDWSQLPATTPQRIRELLMRCLKKDPRQRLQAIGEARIVIEDVLSGTPQEAAALAGPASTQSTWRRALPWAIAGACLVIAGTFAIGYMARAPEQAAAVISQIAPPEGENLVLGGLSEGAPAISPDGRRLAFAAAGSDGREALWVRPLNAASAQQLAGTDGATYPFWSPDSGSLGFFANGKLNRIDASGGPPLPVCDVEPTSRGGTWGPGDTILFTNTVNSPLYRVAASGGTPQPVTKLNESKKEISHRWPQFLPDGKHFLYLVLSSDAANFGGTYVASLDGGEPKFLLHNDSNAIYAPPGYLIFLRNGTLMAQQFDPKGLRLVGQAEPLAERVAVNPNVHRGLFTVSVNGVLAYEGGSSTMGGHYRLLWLDRSGKQTGETGTPAGYLTPRISPDGRKLAVSIISPAGASGAIWVFDLAAGTNTRLTFSSAVINSPAWSPDGKTIAFVSTETGEPHIYQKAADGTGSATPLFVDDATEYAPSFSPDGRYLVFDRRQSQGTITRIVTWAMPLTGDRKPFPVAQAASGPGVAAPAPSPDGKWLAYVSAETGRDEVYVVPFGHGSGKWLVSVNGGEWPRWRGDGKEIFYMAMDGKIVSADIVEQGSSLAIGQVHPLFKPSFFVNVAPNVSVYDVAPDGKKFVVIDEGVQEPSEPLTLVVNWLELLKKQ